MRRLLSCVTLLAVSLASGCGGGSVVAQPDPTLADDSALGAEPETVSESTVGWRPPQRIEPLAGVVRLEARGTRTCALTGDGHLFCWGNGPFPEVANRLGAPDLEQIQRARDFALGTYHSCAIDEAGAVRCEGIMLPRYDGTRIAPEPIPEDLTRATRVTAGNAVTCALDEENAVHCWGWIDSLSGGQRYVSGTTGPLYSEALGGVEQLLAADDFFCAVYHSRVFEDWPVIPIHTCWRYDRLASNLEGAMFRPDRDTRLSHFFRHRDGMCGIGNDETVWCWWAGGEATHKPEYEGYASVAVGTNFACAVRPDGSTWCWGSNDDGQLGNTTLPAATSSSEEPVPVSVDLRAQIVVAGGRHACLLSEDGEVWCWGDSDAF